MKRSRLIHCWLAIPAAFSVLAGCLPATSTRVSPTAILTSRNTAIPTATSTSANTVEPTHIAFETSLRQSDGMVMVDIPAGKFMMGSEEGEADEGPVHEVDLDAFWMDQTEVTNAMYALCVGSDSCMSPIETGSYTRANYYGNDKYADYPVIFVDWSMANAYCAWAGARLPAEAEWEKAARGEDGRVYPWGNDWDVQTHKRLNFADRNNPETTSDVSADDGYGDTAPVRSYEAGKSPYDIYDLAGNVWEWVADWYDPLYYRDSPLNNPLGPLESTQETPMRVLRGGSWVAANQDVFHTSNRNGLEPAKFSSSIGFRCAR
ncbi:MAG TPA: SUMF1/EgtB/PvdO family nonheme iron enzyme [Anaerolineales bacterium]|nr:SUMF1/EgtB/PvdO family nonheme iron enzyme [Anaerolineales bacterium]